MVLSIIDVNEGRFGARIYNFLIFIQSKLLAFCGILCDQFNTEKASLALSLFKNKTNLMHRMQSFYFMPIILIIRQIHLTIASNWDKLTKREIHVLVCNPSFLEILL